MIVEPAQMVLSIALLAMLLELVMGWPRRVFATVGHPVTWLGHMVSTLESLLRSTTGASPQQPPSSTSSPSYTHVGAQRRELLTGALLVVLVCAISVGLAVTLTLLLNDSLVGQGLLVVMVASLFAGRSLYDHVHEVQQPLSAHTLPAARLALSQIVGRDTKNLDESAISRAAIESLSENTSDGIVAPLFWYLLFGLPGLVFYKTVNTMDSMIGYRNPRYLYFGRTAARLDDLINLIPARLTALMYLLIGRRLSRHHIATLAAEAKPHDSPNAGWPEAAMAICLNVQLGGDRWYAGQRHEAHCINATGSNPQASDLAHGMTLLQRLVLCVLFLLTLFLALSLALSLMLPGPSIGSATLWIQP